MAIEISDNALDEVRRMMEKEHVNAAGMRVGVKGGGCSGLSYNLTFETQAVPETKSSNATASSCSAISRATSI